MSINGTIDPHTAAEFAGIHDALKRLVAVGQQTAEPQSSVQIEQAAKPGLPPRLTVKVYHPDPAVAADRAGALYDELLARYQQEGAA